MGYRELIKKIQHESGFSDKESEQALDLMVESIAERLPDEELARFANQLPAELEEIAMLTAMETPEMRRKDIVEEFMRKEEIEEGRARKQVISAWNALKSLISEGQMNYLHAMLPEKTATILV